MKKNHKIKVQPKKWLKALMVFGLSIVAIIAIIFGLFSVALAGKIYPRVSINDISVGGLNPTQAKPLLTENLATLNLKPVILTDGNGQSFTIKPDEIGAELDLDQSIDKAMAVGREHSWLNNLVQKLTTPIFGLDLPAAITVNQEQLGSKINQIIDQVATPTKNADLKFSAGKVTITNSTEGKSIDPAELKAQIITALGQQESNPLELKIKITRPDIKEDEIEPIKTAAERVLIDSIKLTYKDQIHTATPTILGNWLQTKVETKLFQPKLTLTIKEEAVTKFLNSIADKIDLEPQNARLAMVNGSVTIIESSRDGLKVKRDTAKSELLRIIALRQDGALTALVSPSPTDSAIPTPSILSSSSPTNSPELTDNEVALEVEVKKPDVTNDNVNSIGIKERIAVSTTDFKGSPNNRQENIRLGTKLFNGIILKPGDQFSAIKSLGRIDAESGFKPELVIKEDQLATEIGGGLCQVSTTLFRAAMNAGLKIDERRNHRFRVGYYETKPTVIDPEDYVTLNAKTLVGIDATIYDPLPDFKFTNDTGNFILVQGRVDGTRLTFELFGTKDGRSTKIDGPYITSTTPAPKDIQYIDEPNLPAGTIKVKELSHAGAKTRFTYTVTKEGKSIHQNTFSSSYVPWQAKSYRGTGPAVAPSSSPSPDASSSPAVPVTPASPTASTSPVVTTDATATATPTLTPAVSPAP